MKANPNSHHLKKKKKKKKEKKKEAHELTWRLIPIPIIWRKKKKSLQKAEIFSLKVEPQKEETKKKRQDRKSVV